MFSSREYALNSMRKELREIAEKQREQEKRKAELISLIAWVGK